AVLKKGDPSPLLPESDEDPGVGAASSGGGRGRASTDTETTDQPAPRAPRTPVAVQIDFPGVQQRILSVPGVPERQYSRLQAATAGTVFYIEAGAGGGRGRGGDG